MVKIAGSGSDQSLSDVMGITGDPTERYIYLANSFLNTLRVVDTTTGQIATIAGTAGYFTTGEESIPATSGGVYNPTGVTIDTQNNIYTVSFDIQLVNLCSPTLATVEPERLGSRTKSVFIQNNG